MEKISDELGDLLVGSNTDGGPAMAYKNAKKADSETPTQEVPQEIPDEDLDYYRNVDLSSFTVDTPIGEEDPETQEPLKEHVKAGKGRGKGQRKTPVSDIPSDDLFNSPEAKEAYMELRAKAESLGKQITLHLNNFMRLYANGVCEPSAIERQAGMCRRSVYLCFDALGIKPNLKAGKDQRFEAFCEHILTWDKTAGEFIDYLVELGYDRLTKPGLITLVQKYQRLHPDYTPPTSWYAKPGAKSREERAAAADEAAGIKQLFFDFDSDTDTDNQ